MAFSRPELFGEDGKLLRQLGIDSAQLARQPFEPVGQTRERAPGRHRQSGCYRRRLPRLSARSAEIGVAASSTIEVLGAVGVPTKCSKRIARFAQLLEELGIDRLRPHRGPPRSSSAGRRDPRADRPSQALTSPVAVVTRLALKQPSDDVRARSPELEPVDGRRARLADLGCRVRRRRARAAPRTHPSASSAPLSLPRPIPARRATDAPTDRPKSTNWTHHTYRRTNQSADHHARTMPRWTSEIAPSNLAVEIGRR